MGRAAEVRGVGLANGRVPAIVHVTGSDKFLKTRNILKCHTHYSAALKERGIIPDPIKFWEADSFSYTEIYFTNEPQTTSYVPLERNEAPNFDGYLIKSGTAGVPCTGPWDTDCVAEYEREVLGVPQASQQIDGQAAEGMAVYLTQGLRGCRQAFSAVSRPIF